MTKKTGSIYLKTIISTPFELNFLIANLIESDDVVDTFLIAEYDFTHSGEPRQQIFTNMLPHIPSRFHSKIDYKFISLKDKVQAFDSEGRYLRHNEWLMRRGFLDVREFLPEDLIISVDADEIIYARTFKFLRFVWHLFPKNIHLLLTLHQFMYRPNILWHNLKFHAPTVSSFAVLSKQELAAWRYTGLKLPFWAGCHFSWHIPIPDMILKLNTYGHKDKFSHFADPVILRRAVDNLEYPFEPDRDVKMQRVDLGSKILPDSIRVLDWTYLDR